MKKSKHIYHYPLYYEIGFCQTNICREISFFSKCYLKHQNNSPLSSLIDNGCGTGLYIEEFAKSGVRVCGYDQSAEMVDYAGARLSHFTNNSHVFKADLRDFKTEYKYDMGICTNGSFQYLMTVEDVVRHLRCVGNTLVDNGLYLIVLPSPVEFFLKPPGSINSQWSEIRDGIEVMVNWTYRQSPIEWSTQTFSGFAKIDVDDNGNKLSFEMPYRYRIFFLQEIEALVHLSGCFKIEYVYGDYHLGRNFRKMRQAKDMIVLLRKVKTIPLSTPY